MFKKIMTMTMITVTTTTTASTINTWLFWGEKFYTLNCFTVYIKKNNRHSVDFGKWTKIFKNFIQVKQHMLIKYF